MRRRGAASRRGVESTADALMYLAVMLLASAAVFALFPAGATDAAQEQSRLMDGARWTALALADAEFDANGTVSCQLCSGWFCEEVICGIMARLAPAGYGWNVTWASGGVVLSAGGAASGDVGSHAVELDGGVLGVRIWRL